MMTKKDYIKIADTIKDISFDLSLGVNTDEKNTIVNNFSFMLKADNSRFDKVKFWDYINKK